jgi:L-iditol 2-dehydrogenase
LTPDMLPPTMKAAVLHAINDIRCDTVPTPSPAPDEVIVRVRACGICGSDLARVFETGMYHLPEIPGHEFAGEVATLGSQVSAVSIGDRVAVIPLIECGQCPSCLIGQYSMCENYDYLGSRSAGGFAQYVRAPAKNLVPLPPEADYETGAFAEVLSVALHAVRRTGGLLGGERVLVFGAGTVGLLVAQWAKSLGAGAVACVDIVPEKLAIAVELGVDLCLNAMHDDVVERVMEWTGGAGSDITFEASGASAALEQALLSSGKGAKLVLVGRQEKPVNLTVKAFEAILRRQLNVYGTWAWSRLPAEEWRVVLDFASRGLIQVKPLISHRFTIDRAPEAFAMMDGGAEPYQKVLFVFPD